MPLHACSTLAIKTTPEPIINPRTTLSCLVIHIPRHRPSLVFLRLKKSCRHIYGRNDVPQEALHKQQRPNRSHGCRRRISSPHIPTGWLAKTLNYKTCLLSAIFLGFQAHSKTHTRTSPRRLHFCPHQFNKPLRLNRIHFRLVACSPVRNRTRDTLT